MALVVKNPPANAGDPGDMGSIPGSGRSPGGRHSNSLQYSCLENPMDSGAWQAIVHRIATSHTQLKQLHIRAYKHIYPPSHTWSSRPYCLFHCCYSVTKSCPTLCNPTDHSPADFPVLHYLPVCSNSCSLSLWCHPTISFSIAPFSSCLQYFPASGSFPVSQFFTSGGQIIGVSASASVFPMNIQDCFLLGLTGWISLQSKWFSRVFSNTIVQNH